MDKEKKVLMVMPVMKGGGAERVAALLMNEFDKSGYDVKFLLTSSGKDEVIRTDLNENIPLIFLQEQLSHKKTFAGLLTKGVRLYSSLFSKMFETLHKPVPSHFAYCSFVSQYRKEIVALRLIMKENPDMTVISFLHPSIPMTILAGKDLPNKIIISERGNPERLMKHRYGRKFIEKYYQRVNVAVFQTEMAKSVYPESIQEKGVVIPNPIKSDLPEPYMGERNKNITTFCRISKQKNLPMLISSFAMLHKDFPEYFLKIIGDAINEEGESVLVAAKKQIYELDLENYVQFLPFSKNVHNEIIQDAMYVNSSDYEGISNAMLESMAIGMPVVCTNCPVGGARAMIAQRVNGLLVPVNDTEALYKAMINIIEDKEFSRSLSHHASEIRERLSLENISRRWMELL